MLRLQLRDTLPQINDVFSAVVGIRFEIDLVFVLAPADLNANTSSAAHSAALGVYQEGGFQGAIVSVVAKRRLVPLGHTLQPM